MMRQILSVGKTLSSNLVIKFTWRELWLEVRIYIEFWEEACGLVVFMRDLE